MENKHTFVYIVVVMSQKAIHLHLSTVSCGSKAPPSHAEGVFQPGLVFKQDKIEDS